MKKEFDISQEVIEMLERLSKSCNVSESDVISTLVLSSFMQMKKKKLI